MRIRHGALHRALCLPDGVELQRDIEAEKRRLASLEALEVEVREGKAAVTKKNRFADWETWTSISNLVQ